jgi:hypothetical protein
MRTNILSALLCSTILFVPGVALADPPTPKCFDAETADAVASPGAFNAAQRLEDGTPGQNTDGDPANEAAHERNAERKIACPPPGQSPF